VIGISCRFHNSAAIKKTEIKDNNSSSWASSLNPMNLFKDSPSKQEAIYSLKNNIPIRLMSITTDRCSRNNEGVMEDQIWTLPVTSVYGTQKITFTFSPNNSSNTRVSIDDTKFEVKMQNGINQALAEKICEAASGGNSYLSKELSDEINGITIAWISQLSPDCKTAVSDYGLYCQLPEAAQPKKVANHLRSIRKTMIRRWSRQPYILTRRVSVAIELAKALASARPEIELDHLCRVIRSSKPNELPLALSTPAWYSSVCENKTSTNRLAAASTGLVKAASEIDFFKKLYEQTSKLGLLTIKIPRDQTPSKDLLITLVPSEDVKSSLMEELSPSQPQCWHPLFGSQSQKLATANYLNITSPIEIDSCNKEELSTQFRDVNKMYLADSITSETEFIITNGRSKVLRLPNGEYTYKIQPHSNKIGDAPEPAISSEGSIVWKNKRPQATIKKW